MLILNNGDVSRLLTMAATMEALEKAYLDLVAFDAVCRPRIDLEIPTSDPAKLFTWGTMEGGVREGYFAIRMKSDIIYFEGEGRGRTKEKYCVRPGLFCGLILLVDVNSGEPVALLNDGVIQHMRVGADGGIGAKYMARPDARTVGMLGSGGMARAHMEAFVEVRDIRRLQVFSPTQAHREAFAREMAEKHGIEAIAVDRPEDVYGGADILSACTDSASCVIEASRLEPGTHVVNVGGRLDQACRDRITRSLRLGEAPAPRGRPELSRGRNIVYAAWQDDGEEPPSDVFEERSVTLAEVLQDPTRGRGADDEITHSVRGNVQGLQFYSVAAIVYEGAKKQGLGHTIPTDWLLQDIRN